MALEGSRRTDTDTFRTTVVGGSDREAVQRLTHTPYATVVPRAGTCPGLRSSGNTARRARRPPPSRGAHLSAQSDPSALCLIFLCDWTGLPRPLKEPRQTQHTTPVIVGDARRCVRPFVSQRPKRHASKQGEEFFVLGSAQCVDVSLLVEKLIASVSEAAHEGPHDVVSLHEDFDFYDDVSGHKLDHAMAKKARTLETEYFQSMGVYSKVPRAEAIAIGCKVTSTRWLDVNKGDDEAPNCRSRFVCCAVQEEATPHREH